MVLRYVFLFLLLMAVQCEQMSNSSTAQLDSKVISPYRRVLTLLTSNIVDKLTNVDLAHANHSVANLPYEFHCTVEEMQLTLQQIASNNQLLLSQVTIHIDELLNSISRLENETKHTEILMNELNDTVETAREDLRCKEAAHEARRRFSRAMNYFREPTMFARNNDHGFYDYGWHGISGRHNHGHPYQVYRGSGIIPFRFHTRHQPWYQSSQKAIDRGSNELEIRQQQLEDEIAKYNATQSRLENILQQLVELNATLQQQQIVRTMSDALNGHFQLLTNRLKTASTSSKRLIDVLMYALDYETIVKPLNSVYETLRSENMLEMTDVKLSKESMENIKRKLTLLTARLPQMRYRRKQFHQPCAFSTPGSTRN